ALIGGRAHFLDALDRLELGLDRAQQQPLGIFRRNSLIDQADIDDRNGNVRFRFLRDVDVGQRPRDHQEDERGKRQPRIADRYSYDIHDRALEGAASRIFDQLPDGFSVGLDRIDRIAFGDHLLPRHNDAYVFRNAAEHQTTWGIVDQVDREEHDLVVCVDGADAQVTGCTERNHGSR